MKTLTMHYTVNNKYVVCYDENDVTGASRVIETAIRAFSGVPNVDPESVRFTVDDGPRARSEIKIQ